MIPLQRMIFSETSKKQLLYLEISYLLTIDTFACRSETDDKFKQRLKEMRHMRKIGTFLKKGFIFFECISCDRKFNTGSLCEINI